MKKCLALFWAFFKIGLFTFGGGYAMISVIERDIVEKKKWILQQEFLDVCAIAESTPGPLAINSATYIGYKVRGFFGSLFATLGVVLPSLIIIFIISLFFEQFLALKFVGYAFRGIQACVAFLILSAGIKMAKSLKKNIFNYFLLFAVIGVMMAFELFAISFSTIFYILIGGGIGVVVYLVTLATIKMGKKKVVKTSVNESGAKIPNNEEKSEKEGE